jgi:hypothetical protein
VSQSIRQPVDPVAAAEALTEVGDWLAAWQVGDESTTTVAHHVFRLGGSAVRAVGDCRS